MTTIRPGAEPITLINVFTVDPENQQALIDALIEMTDATLRHLPGFVSANFHKSLDGTRVANYAQWETKEHFDAILAMPEVLELFRSVEKLGTAHPFLYEVVSTHES